jgi:glycosyltransferase involved in cell wall biosynthesis
LDEFSGASRVSIIVPAYNEEKTIREVVLKARKYGEVIVVDDGSTDGTATLAREAGATVISHSRNFGQSAADRTGYLNSTREVVATIDADIQQVPDELPRVINPILNNQADMVIGSKFLGRLEYRPNLPNLFMERLICTAMRIRFGVRMTNAFSGMRAMRRSSIDFAYLKGDKHECAVELAFSFAWHNRRIMEVPRTARRRISGKSSIKILDGSKIMIRAFTVFLTPPKDEAAVPRSVPTKGTKTGTTPKVNS